jgi:hypothetical protein
LYPDYTTRTEPQATDFIGDALKAERLTLRAGWHDPGGFHEAACDCGLTGGSWADPAHSYLFCYICLGFEEGREPNFNTFTALVADHGIGLNDHDILELTCFAPDPDVTLPELCEIVAANGERRERARALLAEAAELLSGHEYEVTLRTTDITNLDGVELVA